MTQWEVEWSLKGSSLVEAESEEEAKKKVWDKSDEVLYGDIDGFDISDVERKEQNDGGDAE